MFVVCYFFVSLSLNCSNIFPFFFLFLLLFVFCLIIVWSFHFVDALQAKLGLVQAELLRGRDLELGQCWSELLDQPRVDDVGVLAGLPLLIGFKILEFNF
jgi:hypothetical protein